MASKMAGSPGALDWAESSVRWLADKHPEYSSGSASATWPAKLTRSLMAMSWRQASFLADGTRTMPAYRVFVKRSVEGWTEEHHQNMEDFLEAGGYTAELRATEASVVVGKDGERIEIELAELADIEEGLEPKSQLSPDHELEEVVTDAVLRKDPRYGAW